MIDGYRYWLTILAIVGTGTMTGVFQTFSGFTMNGIRRLPDVQAVRAMQSVNRSAERSVSLLGGLFGTGVVCVVLGAVAIGDLDHQASVLHLVASALYLLGVVVMTVAFHVPRNNALAAVDPDSPGAPDHWVQYARTWTAGNHIRTSAPLVSTVLYAVSLRAG